jgi:hypothetical protein
MKYLTHLIAFMLLVAAMLAQGAEPVADPAAHTVIVPYNLTTPLEQRTPTRYYLPYEEFQRLWQTAKEHRRPPLDMVDDQVSATILSASYRGRLEDTGLMLKARLEVMTRGPWAALSLPISMGDGAALLPGDLRLDGKPSALAAHQAETAKKPGSAAAGGQLRIEKAGTHVIEFTMALPPLLPGGTISVDLPEALAGVLYLEAPTGEEWLTANEQVYRAELEPAGVRVYAIPINDPKRSARENRVVLYRPTRGLPRGEGPVPQATVSTKAVLHHLMPSEFEAEVAMNFPGAARRTLNFSLDGQVKLTEVAVFKQLPAGKIRIDSAFQRGPAGDRGPVRVTLAHEVSDSVTVLFKGSAASFLSRTPLLVPEADRQQQRVTLMHEEDMEVKVKLATGQTRVQGSDKDQNKAASQTPEDSRIIREGVYSIDATQPLSYQIRPTDDRDEASVNYVFQLSEQKSELLAALSLKRKRGAWTNARIGLPAGYDVQTISGPALKQWQHVGADLYLHFDPALAGSDARVIVHLAQTVDQPVTSWKIEPLKSYGFQKHSGRGLIAAHAATQVRLPDISKGQGMQEMDPTALDSLFTIAPPFEKKRGLRLEGLAWTLEVALARQPVRFSADAIALVLVSDAGIRVSQQVAAVVEQGALRQMSVRLPATLPEAVVSGPLLREMRTRIDGADRVYDCSFQTDVLERAELTFDHDLPLTGTLAVPLVKVEGAERLQRFFVLDNASGREAKVSESAALERVSRDVVPYLPEGLARPQFYRAISDASRLTVSYTQLTATEANAALVTLADITTVLRADGERWDTVTYSLVNRSLQFLPLILPEGAELISVSVSGEAVRADEEMQGGKRVRLIPLIHTQAGQRALAVRLVWRFQPGDWNSAKLDDPELVGLSAERTSWTVWTPAGFKLSDFDGNMDEVDAEGKELQKLEGMLSELGNVNRALASGKLGYKEAQSAYSSASRLASDINKVKEEVVEKARRLTRSDSDDKPRLRKAGTASKPDTETQAEGLEKDVAKQRELLEGNWSNYAKKANQPDVGPNKSLSKTESKTDWNYNKAAPQPVKPQMRISNTFGNDDLQQQGAQVVNDNVAVNNRFFETKDAASAAPAPAAPASTFTGMITPSGSVTVSGTNTYTGNTQNMQTQGVTQQGANLLNSNARGNNLSQVGNLDANAPAAAPAPAQSTGAETINRSVAVTADPLPALPGLSINSMAMPPAAGQRFELRGSFGLGDRDTMANANPFGASPAPAAPASPAQFNGGTLITSGGIVTRGVVSGTGNLSASTAVAAQLAAAEPAAIAVAQTVESLRPTGRRSLEVEVPLAGEVRHFSKLKDHAVLELKITRPWEARQTRTAWVLGLGLLFAAGWSKFGARGRRAAA